MYKSNFFERGRHLSKKYGGMVTFTYITYIVTRRKRILKQDTPFMMQLFACQRIKAHCAYKEIYASNRGNDGIGVGGFWWQR